MEYVQDEMRKIVQEALSSSIVLYVLLVIGWAIKAILETAGVRDPTQLPIVGPLLIILAFGIVTISALGDVSDSL